MYDIVTMDELHMTPDGGKTHVAIPNPALNDSNGYLSIKEIFNISKEVYFLKNHPMIPQENQVDYGIPQIDDPKNIAESLYFGDYSIKKI
jgi:hypothetical protein